MIGTPEAVTKAQSPISQAFAKLVDSENDIVGLLAYALFKRGIREEAQRGVAVGITARDPAPTVIATYRHAADSIIADIVEKTLNDNISELQQSAMITALETAQAGLESKIITRTSFGLAVLAGVVAWSLSLILTVMLIWLSGKGDAVSALLRG